MPSNMQKVFKTKFAAYAIKFKDENFDKNRKISAPNISKIIASIVNIKVTATSF